MGHKRRVGRPSLFTAELAAAICERISLGESLRSICRDEGMPEKLTVLRWLSQDDQFCAQYARARDLQADTHAEDIVDISDTEPDPAKARVRIDARKWFASKVAAKKYGDATLLKHADADGNRIQAIVNVTISGT